MVQGFLHAVRARGWWNGRRRNHLRRGGAALAVLALAVGVLQAAGPLAPPSLGSRLQPSPPDPVHVSAVHGHRVAAKPMPDWKPAHTTWPQGTADVAFDATASATEPVKAAKLPLWIRSETGRNASPDHSGSRSVHLAIPQHTAATRAGVAGVLVSLTPGASTTATPAEVQLGYGTFRNAYGGDWATRLRLVALPTCALTTPSNAACRRQTPISFTNDTKDQRLIGRVVLPATKAGSHAPQSLVLAATSSPSGSGGSYGATSLSASGQWTSGSASGGFDYTETIPAPAVPGNQNPNIKLTYSSQAVDGLTSSTNNQASWIGDGWDYTPGFVERSYQSCYDNPAGPTKTGDQCWGTDNTVSFSLNGKSTTLVRDDTTGQWRAQNDNSERVQLLTGASNGAHGGEYWVITTDDGTRYYFGLNQLPGFAGSDQATNSVWTEPVFATASGQSCYDPTFANSWCEQAYRWNLDYVVDAHSDAMSYFYTAETNYYARDNGSTANTSYTRGGYLTKIQYGQRDGQVYTTPAPGQVTFTPTGRCTNSTCDPATLTSSTASAWPDVPYDMNCASGAACSNTWPTFWSEYRLASISTQVLVGTTEKPVDSWSLAATFPSTGDITTPTVWLSSITRTGQDGTAVSLPPITFGGQSLSNRVTLTNGIAPITRQRLTSVTTEFGGVIGVDYSSPGCASATPSAPDQNTMLCYPDYWTPDGAGAPVLDWFNKFVVTEVDQQEPATNGPTIRTAYSYVGDPAWHHNDNPSMAAKYRTWDQWRGYATVKTFTGTAPDPVTETEDTYFRGMDGDTLSGGGTRSAQITDSRGEKVTDSAPLAGVTREHLVLDGSDGPTVTDTVTDPWVSAATATHALSGLPTETAHMQGTAATRTYTALAGGGTQETETDNTYDSYGRVTQVNDQGDVSTTSDDLCTTTSYATNTSAWILLLAARISTVSVNCQTTPTLPDDAVSDTLMNYDGSTTNGAAPTIGDVTLAQQAVSYSGSTPQYATTAENTSVDQYGRPLTTNDADGRTTTTTYTPATGAAPTSVTVTDPAKLVTTTVYDPARNLPTKVTDPAGYVSTETYDALGRLTSVW
jgi:YD repeat-containing protein